MLGAQKITLSAPSITQWRAQEAHRTCTYSPWTPLHIYIYITISKESKTIVLSGSQHQPLTINKIKRVLQKNKQRSNIISRVSLSLSHSLWIRKPWNHPVTSMWWVAQNPTTSLRPFPTEKNLTIPNPSPATVPVPGNFPLSLFSLNSVWLLRKFWNWSNWVNAAYEKNLFFCNS